MDIATQLQFSDKHCGDRNIGTQGIFDDVLLDRRACERPSVESFQSIPFE
jgi:hypothetical protein